MFRAPFIPPLYPSPPSPFLLLSSYSPSVRVFSKLDRRFPATTQPTRIYSHTAHKTWRKERERENVLLLWAMFSRVCVDIRHSTVLLKRRNKKYNSFRFFFILYYTERVPEKKKEGLAGWLVAVGSLLYSNIYKSEQYIDIIYSCVT